jgi:hypothetical protein
LARQWIDSLDPYIRRYGLPTFWFAFVLRAIWLGQYPVYADFASDSNPGYQWEKTSVAIFVITIATIGLHYVIRPSTYSLSSPRFGKAFGLSIVYLMVATGLFSVTDMPGVYYLPSTFAFLTCALMLALAAVETIVLEVRKRRERT